jgi:hypothetical protein
MLIEVTAEDIEGSTREDCQDCAVARAICRTLRLPASAVWVDGVFLTVIGRDYRTPDHVNAFIRDFDAGDPVSPISFTLGDGS